MAYLEAEHLRKLYPMRGSSGKKFVQAVDDVSFSLEQGEILGVIGESGCGKSTLGRMLIGLESISSGQVKYDGQDLNTLMKNGCRQFRQTAQMVFQNPFDTFPPGQTMQHLAEDLYFLQELKPQMVGIGPFIPHHDTTYANEPAGSVELTLFLLSILRIMLPRVLLPATTALGTLDPLGREKGLAVGANVVMPNLSPVKNRKKYELYDNKICTGEEAAECRGCLSRRVERAGYRLVEERGDAVS